MNLNESQFQYVTDFPPNTSSSSVKEVKRASCRIAMALDVCGSGREDGIVK